MYNFDKHNWYYELGAHQVSGGMTSSFNFECNMEINDLNEDMKKFKNIYLKQYINFN